MKLYKTVKGEGYFEQIIEKSRFICTVIPVSEREEAEEFFKRIKKQYRDATHNVPCMVIGDKMQLQWGSDDGEPQGTSAAPIVQMLVSEGITNVALVVTRYFGGIKLGTGGLVRAYSGTAKSGVEAAGICEVEDMTGFRYSIDYSALQKLQKSQADGNYTITDIVYAENVEITLACSTEKEEDVIRTVENFTAGKAILLKKSTIRVKNSI